MPFAPTPATINCPFCRSSITVPIQQVVDVSEEPRLKAALLGGLLNMFRCPACGNSGTLAAPFFYHDPDKELALIFMPMEAGLQNADQQRLIGSLTNAVMSGLPPEKRKAYLLQPRQFFTLQNLVEAVLEADGITPEMIAAQRAKMDLLQTIADVPSEELPAFIQEHDGELDEEFFDLFNTIAVSAQANGAERDYEQLVELRDQLLEHSTVGRRIAVQQQMLQAFAENPSRETLLEQLIEASDEDTRKVLVGFGRSLLDYPFFQALTAKIEKVTAAGDKDMADKLIALRREIQLIREELDAATRALFERRAELLREIMGSEELDEAARTHVSEFDDVFFSVLQTNIEMAQRSGQQATLDRLQAVGEAAMRAIQATQPPEVRLVNALLAIEYPDETARLLEANQQALSPELLNWMRHLVQDMRSRERNEAADKLEKIIEQAAEMTGQEIAVARK